MKKDTEAGIKSADTTSAGKQAGASFGKSFTPEVTSRASKFHSGINFKGLGSRSGQDFGDGFSVSLTAKTLSAIGPGILGADLKKSGILMGGTLAAGLLPGLTAGLGAGVVTTAGLALGGIAAGAISAGAKALIGDKTTQGPLYAAAQQAGKTLQQGIIQAAKPMIPQLQSLFAQVGPIMARLMPGLQSMFAGAATLIQPLVTSVSNVAVRVLPLLGDAFRALSTMVAPLVNGLGNLAAQVLPLLSAAFRATAPLVEPLIGGITKLITGLMPGLISMMQAAGPAVQALGGLLGSVGGALGDMFSAFTPAITASSSMIRSLGVIIQAIMPVLANLAGIFAEAMAPAFAAFARIIQSLAPILTLLGQVIGQIAKAMLEDLNWALKALVDLFVAIQPALRAFVQAIGQAFTVLENTGVFQAFGAALVQVVPLIATMANTILNTLTPILPQLISLIGQVAATLANIFAGALRTVLPVITQLVVQGLQVLAEILPVIAPPLLQVAQIFATTLAGAVAQVLPPLMQLATTVLRALAQILPQILPPLAGLAAAFGDALVRALVALMPALIQLTDVVLKTLLAVLPLIVPPLNAFASLIKSIPGPVLAGIAAAILGIVAGLKIWAAIQAVLNVLLAANPIGIVVIALAALVAGLILAYQHSATFRDIVKGAFHEIGMVAGSVAIVFLQGIKFMVDGFLGLVGTVVNGAATMFGWIPGIGGKIKGAADAFNRFRDGVNGDFNSMIGSIQGWQRQQEAAQLTTQATTAAIMGHFNNQRAASDRAKQGIDALTASIQVNGANSTATATARQNLINDMVKAGVSSTTAKADVDRYTAAVATNGVNSDAARGARQRLVTDLASASQGAVNGKRDVDNLTTAVRTHGSASDEARSARQRLIADLANAGVSARDAAKLVDGLTASLGRVPRSVTPKVMITLSGSGGVSVVAPGEAARQFMLKNAATGMLVTGGIPGKDSVLIAAMPGELVVPEPMVRAGAVDHLRGKIPGFASGGVVEAPGWVGAQASDIVSAWAGSAVQRALNDMISKYLAAAAQAVQKTITAGTAGTAGGVIAVMMKNMAAARGWTGAQWNALYALEMGEAGFNMTATNPTSGAYGLAQGITGPSWYYQWPGGDPTTAQGQINGFFAYIASRYGTPVAAYSAWLSRSPHWYRNGGPIPEPVLGLGRSGDMYQFEAGENVQSAAEAEATARLLSVLAGKLDKLIDATRAVPAGVGRSVGGALGGAAEAGAYGARYPHTAW